MNDEEIKNEIRKFALQNAAEHEGQTRDKTILAKIMGNVPELRQKAKEISPIITEIVSEINQIIFKYCNQNGEVNNETNPNGSIENIAGITNEQGNVLGMMPHPERATCEITKLSDGENLFKSISEFLL